MRYTTRDHFVDAAFQQTQRPFRRKVVTLSTAITDQFIDLAGDFLYIDQASTGYVTIELNTAGAGVLDPITLGAGGAIEANFANFKISATAQLGKSVTLIIGNGARVKGGATINPTSESITSIPGQKLISASGRAFMGIGYQAATAGQISHAQLMNPTGNTRNVYLTSIRTGAVAMTISSYDTPLTYLYGNPGCAYLGQAAATAQVRVATNPTSLYTTLFGITQANSPYVFERPFLLPPGTGVILAPETVNTLCYPTFEFFEE